MEDKKECDKISLQSQLKTTTSKLLLSRSCCKLVDTGPTSGVGTTYPSGTNEFISGF
jgi:hypothetical protein